MMYTVTRSNIWNFRQNNPELVIQDAKQYLGLSEEQCCILRTILLARGINKWLKVRRDLIAYKKQIKHKVRLYTLLYSISKHTKYREMYRELLKTYEEIRKNLKLLCSTDRYQIWPQLGSHHKELESMNTIKASD